MKACHNCPHAADIAAGKHKHTPWSEVPCADCDPTKTTERPVEYKEWRRSTAIDDDPAAGLDAHLDPEAGPEADRLPVDVMREIVACLLDLPPVMRDVVSWRYAGMSYVEIAELQGASPQCIERRHRRAMERWPALRSLFPEKAAKRDRWQRNPPNRPQGAPTHGQRSP